MRIVGVMALLLLGGCVSEDTGVVAARMEAQDDASCRSLSAGKGEGAYQQCRQNLIGYRREANAESAERRERWHRAGEALRSAGAALQDSAPSRSTQTVCNKVGPSVVCNTD
jgi:hypothetical protein